MIEFINDNSAAVITVLGFAALGISRFLASQGYIKPGNDIGPRILELLKALLNVIPGVNLDEKKNKIGPLVVVFAVLSLQACATFKALTHTAGDALQDTGEAILEDVDWQQHIHDFVDSLFGPQTPEDPQAPVPEAGE